MIYHVQVTYDTVVEADSQHEAVRVARLAAREEICEAMDNAQFDADQIAMLSELPTAWDGNCLPWGGDGKTPLREMLM